MMTACVGSRGRCHLNSCWMQVLAQTSCRSCGQAESEAAATGRGSPLAAPGSGLHWKSVLSRALVSDKFSVAWPQSRSANWQKHTDTQSPIIARYSYPPLHFSIKAHSWSVHVTQKLSRSSLTGSPSEKLKVEQVGDKSQNAVFLRKKSLLWGGGKFQCWHRKLFGEWTAFYWNRRIEIASGIPILFESEYTHFIECWNDFTNFYNMLMEIMIMCNSKYFFSLKSCQ